MTSTIQHGSDSRIAKSPKRDSFSLWSRVAAGLLLVVFLVIGCGGWAAMARLEGAVIAAGIVKVDQNLKEVQHRDGGIIRSLGIRQGDLVKEGQILATLDDVQVKAELLIVRSQLAEALGRRARLIAERDSMPSIVFPDELKGMASSADAVIHGEMRLFAGNKRGRDSQKEQLELSRRVKKSTAWSRGSPQSLRKSSLSATSEKSSRIYLRRRSLSTLACIRRTGIGPGYRVSAVKLKQVLRVRKCVQAKSRCRLLPLIKMLVRKRNAIFALSMPG
jgi:multidrug efflux pump subunit AcrA (membrane-fusion protein)